MSLNQVNSSGELERVAGLVNSEKINEMYEAFPSDASASNKLATQNDALPSEPINGVITITAVTGATATATTNYTRLRTGDLVNVVINSDVVFSESWWGTVSGLSALGITNIQSLFAVRGSRRIQARVCYNGTKYLDFISDAVIPSTASASNKLVTESDVNPIIDVSTVWDSTNHALSISTLLTTYGLGSYMIYGQGSSGHGCLLLNVWKVLSGSLAYSWQKIYNNNFPTNISGGGIVYDSPTLTLESTNMGEVNNIKRISKI